MYECNRRIVRRYVPISLSLLILILLYSSTRNYSKWADVDKASERLAPKMHPDISADKWVVVTTIQGPTRALYNLVQMKEWKVVVVADRKTPTHFTLPGAIFLDLASQKALGYEVYQYLPFDSYMRKIIGYVYAIDHGARYIFDTDDDQYTEDALSQFVLSSDTTHMLLLNTTQTAVNYFRHFGQSTVWPRGYPLDSIGDVSSRVYSLCELRVPAMQQSLINGDPDVDAMFRLTRKNNNKKLDIRLDNAAPPMVLPKGSFSPTNTQNTLFTFNALWALFLPVSVTSRCADIYRSYWAERLLWEIGENTGFFPPTGTHLRNPHSYIADAMEETNLYHKMGRYLKFLSQWTCKKIVFPECMSALTHDLVVEGFLENQDVKLVDAWIRDLHKVGYVPPMKRSGSGCKSPGSGIKVVFYPNEQYTALPHSTELHLPIDSVNHAAVETLLEETCGSQHSHHWHRTLQTATKYPFLLLVVSIQSEAQSVIPLLTAVYQPNFPNIVFCGPQMSDENVLHKYRVTYITPENNNISGVSCVLTAFLLRYQVEGFVHVSSQMLLNVGESFARRNTKSVWTTTEVDVTKPEILALCVEKKLDCFLQTKDAHEELKQLANEIKTKNDFNKCFEKSHSDRSAIAKSKSFWITESTFFVPARSVEKFQEVAAFFIKDRSRQKFAFLTPHLMECMQVTVERLAFGAFNDPKSDDYHVDVYFPYQFEKVPLKTERIHENFCKKFRLYEQRQLRA